MWWNVMRYEAKICCKNMVGSKMEKMMRFEGREGRMGKSNQTWSRGYWHHRLSYDCYWAAATVPKWVSMPFANFTWSGALKRISMKWVCFDIKYHSYHVLNLWKQDTVDESKCCSCHESTLDLSASFREAQIVNTWYDAIYTTALITLLPYCSSRAILEWISCLWVFRRRQALYLLKSPLAYFGLLWFICVRHSGLLYQYGNRFPSIIAIALWFLIYVLYRSTHYICTHATMAAKEG